MKNQIISFASCALLSCALTLTAQNIENTSLGNNALPVATNKRNVAIGDYSLNKNTAGKGNSALGFEALKNNVSGEFNTAVGGFTLTAVTNSSNDSNTAVGYKSQEFAIGNKNVTMGYQSFQYGTGSYNVAIGTRAMSNSRGTDNIAVGYSATDNVTGSNNTAIGSWALRSGQSANTAIGYKSQTSATGNSTPSVGYYTLKSTTGRNNVAVGNYALQSHNSGGYNTAIGASALSQARVGNKNTGVGHSALHNVTGSENTALGSGAGRNITTGMRNIAIGLDAGGSINSSYNIIMGYRSEATTSDNNIIIGKKITLPAGTSNGLNIGGVLFGSGLHSELPDYPSAAPANGRIGINVVNPQATLDVNGDIRANEIKINLNGGADFVFAEDYKLMNLSDLDEFVSTNKHLPDVAPAAEMVSEGVDMGEFQIKLLQKIEELTLYIIEQDKRIQELENK
ncbi:MAG: hypothetical protein LBR75_01240 [Prevotellaceae bacterium]|jgi:hypothetical protein|nr:hypothetical protein [Prevotellaceae bacterium]